MAFSEAATGRLRRLPLRIAVVALYPRAARFTYAPGFCGRRGVLVYVTACTAFLFAMVAWVVPAAQRRVEADERERDGLSDALGREPTDEEFFRRLAEVRRDRRRRR